MPQNRLKFFPTAVLRRGMAHFHPALPLPGYLPPRYTEVAGELLGEAGGPRPTMPLTAEPASDWPAPAAPGARSAARAAAS